MPVIYRNKKITPAPFYTMTRNVDRADNNVVKKLTYTFVVKGKLLAYKGSPNGLTNDIDSFEDDHDAAISPEIAADPDQRQKLIQNKIAAMTALFCKEGYWFEIQPWDGSAPIKFIPKIRNIEWGDNSGRNIEFFEYVNYTITMDTDKVYLGNSLLDGEICDNQFTPDETWAIESNDDKQRTYRVTHTLSCSMLDKYTDDGNGTLEQKGWERARDLVNERVGLSADFLADAVAPFQEEASPNNVIEWIPYNRVRSVNVNELTGSYSLTESWILYDGPGAFEEFTVSTKTSADDGRTRVTIDGSINGYSINADDSAVFTDGDKTRYQNAQSYFTGLIGASTFYNRACLYSTGVSNSLNPVPQSQSVTHNPPNGIINYTIEYDNRKCFMIVGALQENISVTDDKPTDVFAELVAVGNEVGPILQPINTITKSHRSLSIDVTMPSPYSLTCGTFATAPDTDAIVALFVPAGRRVFKDRDSVTWSPTNGKYNRSVGFSFVV